MGLNNIQLPASLVLSLYQNSLIEQKDEAVQSPHGAGQNKKIEVSYLGNNEKKIALLVDYPNEVYLPEMQLQFLTTILTACKLNLGDVAVINCAGKPLPFESIIRKLDCRYILIFGVQNLSPLLTEIPFFSAQEMNGRRIVRSPVLEELNHPGADGKLLKSKLWLSLKQLFPAG